MSRIVNRAIDVVCDRDEAPVAVHLLPGSPPVPVLSRLAHWREWIGVIAGEPERDVWRVSLPQGVCELHSVRFPQGAQAEPGDWLLFRWED